MKRFIIAALAVTMLTACKNETSEKSVKKEDEKGKTLSPINDSILGQSVIYEANIRQYSPEGIFNEFTKDIPQLKELGVKVIWLMPVYPISSVKRKAADGRFAEEIEDPKEREKILGSYYAISDYTGINPEFGTLEDFQELVKTAHGNGMYVILDWVANHTGWDHVWIEEHPEFYTKNENGEIIDPINPDTGESWGWTDVADLNYDNKALWTEMRKDMRYWVEEQNIDGFRCDVAGEVPTEFWESAVEEMKQVKPIFMLAESEDKDLFEKAFDMGYNWEGHHILNAIAQGKQNAKDLSDYMKKIDTTYQEDDYLMNFVTNHDENSWNGTVNERMGNAAEVMTALSFTLPGMPLIYSGQEYDMQKRLRFFEKDTIVFGNLPYNSSTKILSELILQKKWPPWYEILVLMFQKEVAERIIAKTNTKQFSRLTVLSNWRMDIKKHFDISNNCFFPKPKVTSTVLSFKPKKNFKFTLNDPKNLEKVTRILFSNRRKMINKNFNKLFEKNKDVAKKLNIDLSKRAGELNCEMFYKIAAEYEHLFY